MFCRLWQGIWVFIERCYGACWRVPIKSVDMVKTMYKNCRCAVVDETSRVVWGAFRSKTRLCYVRLLIFHCHWLGYMKRTAENNKDGIRWRLTTTLDDLDFADNLALLSSRWKGSFSRWTHAQEKLNRLDQFGRKVGLKINAEKTKVLRYNPGRLDPLTIEERKVDDVDSFVYLGAKVDKQGGTASDIRSRLGKARVAFNKLNKVWKK